MSRLFFLLSGSLLLSVLCACEQPPKTTYLREEISRLHQIEQGDSNTYAYVNLDNNQFGEVTYSWTQADSSSLDALPIELANSSYFVEENTLDTQADGFPSARFFQQDENGDLKMLGFRTKEGSYWIRSDDDNSYGLEYLTTDLLDNQETISASGSVFQCTSFGVCNNVGSLSWTAEWITASTKETPFGKFESIKIDISGAMNIVTAETTFPNGFFEGLTVYPPVGVVHREIEQGVLDNTVWVDMKLSNTNIVVPEPLVQTEEVN